MTILDLKSLYSSDKLRCKYLLVVSGVLGPDWVAAAAQDGAAVMDILGTVSQGWEPLALLEMETQGHFPEASLS